MVYDLPLPLLIARKNGTRMSPPDVRTHLLLPLVFAQNALHLYKREGGAHASSSEKLKCGWDGEEDYGKEEGSEWLKVRDENKEGEEE